MYGYPFHGGSMAPGMSYLDPGAMQQQSAAKFEPSKSLRQLITECMEEQQECLVRRGQQLAHFMQMSYDADNNLNRKKGPGDEQISAEMSQAVTGYGTGTVWQFGMPWTRAPFHDDRDGYNSRIASGRGARARVPMVPPKIKPSKKKDPMGRYAQLEEEIQALVRLSLAMADPLPNSMKTPQALAGTLHKNVLTKILGTGQLSDDEQSDDGQMAIPQAQTMTGPVPQSIAPPALSPQGMPPPALMGLPMGLPMMGPPMGGPMGAPSMGGFAPVGADPDPV